ncbi:N-acetylneuraminate synthase family protein [Thalassospira xiamenensis]|uniref:N-acetylneuraminate synthase family protein n=1 Tax=Thalassospira xiamenensis TaxID=220697 RepID=UPI000DEDBE5E|nr:N-acetylneuraminate synthase family protein [Thalassospira xiamenensis]
MRPIFINGRQIGAGAQPYLIAEIGINHGGDVGKAKELIVAASKAGADSVKLQCYRSEEFLAPSSEYFHILKDAELSEEAIIDLVGFANQHGITLFASVFDEPSAEFMASLDTPAFKVASGDLTHLPLLMKIAEYGKPIVLSSGGATLGDIETAIECIRQVNHEIDIALLHCVSSYPTKAEDTNLACLSGMRKQFSVPIGFSDHTLGETSAVAAVALGAELIEKHFTLDRNDDGPDHALSSDPNGLAVLAEAMQSAWKSIGSSSKKPVEESRFVKQIRRSLNARVSIPAGSIITSEMLAIRRPGTGIDPIDVTLVLGRKSKHDIEAGFPIVWGMLE